MGSVFTKLAPKGLPNPVSVGDYVGSFESRLKPSAFGSNQSLFESLSQNHLLILNFNKLVLDNVFFAEESHLEEGEIDKLIFRIECLVEKGN